MADPVTLSAAAIVTLLATKTLEKSGEAWGKNLGEAISTQVGAFVNVLRARNPETAAAIDQASQHLNSSDIQALAQQVEQILGHDSELQQQAEAIKTVVQAQPGAVVNMAQLAEKIGINIQGGTVTFTGPITI